MTCIGAHFSEVCATEDKYDEPQNICSLRKKRYRIRRGDQKLSGILRDSFADVSGSPVSENRPDMKTRWFLLLENSRQSAALTDIEIHAIAAWKKEMLIPPSQIST